MKLVQTIRILQKDKWEQNVVKQEKRKDNNDTSLNTTSKTKASTLLHNKKTEMVRFRTTDGWVSFPKRKTKEAEKKNGIFYKNMENKNN